MKMLICDLAIPIISTVCLFMVLSTAQSAPEPESANIAGQDCSAIILPSSQSVDENLQVERATDNDPNTNWVSDVGTFPNWVEVRWPQPVFVNRLLIHRAPADGMQSYKVMVFTGGKWKEVASGSTVGDTIDASFPKVKTLRLRIYMYRPGDNSSAAISSINDLQVFGYADWIQARKRMYKTDPKETDSASPKISFHCKSFKAAEKVKPGNRLRIDIELQANSPVRDDYGFILRIGEESLIPTSNLTIAAKEIMPANETSKWKPGDVYKLSASIYIPDWAPHGEFPVTLTPAVKGLTGAMDNGEDNVIGYCKIQKFAADPVPWKAVTPKTEVKFVNGNPKLSINGKFINPYIMTHPDYFTYEAIGLQAKPGCRIWRLLPEKRVKYSYDTPEGRKENDEYLKMVDQQINCLLKAAPDAYILVGAILRAAWEWSNAYPDDTTLLSNGQRVQYSLSSRRWARQLDNDFRVLVKHLMSQSYSGHIIGIHFEMALETQYWGFEANTMSTPREGMILGDYSPEHIRAFREWLKVRYKDNVDSLRAAWKDPAVNFETAYPDIKTLSSEDTLMFKDPAKSRLPMDYWEFHADQMVNMTNVAAKAVKEASGGRYITGLWGFYDDGIFDGPMPAKMQYLGHTGLHKILESPYIDYLAFLQSYAHRRWGSPMYEGQLADSVRRHGKMPLIEFDTRTFFTPLEFTMRTFNQQETLSVTNSYLWGAALRGDALWWVGFSRGNEGRLSVPWLGEESVLDTLKRGRMMYDAIYNTPSPSTSEIAVFMNNADLWAMDLFDGFKPLVSAQYQTSFFEMSQLGAPVDYYELNDISLDCMDQYKVYVFLNAYSLTPAQRETIKARVRRAGKTAVWLYGAGYSSGSELSVSHMEEITGIKTGVSLERMIPTVNFEQGHALTANIPAGYTLQHQKWSYDPRPHDIGPIFYADDGSAEILGRYAHNGQAAYVSKMVGGGRSIFLAIPYISSVVLRDICRAADVHLFTETDTYLDADKHFILITNRATPFNQTINLPRKSTVYDIWNQKIIAKDVMSFKPNIPALTSRIYFYGTDAEAAEFRKQEREQIQ